MFLKKQMSYCYLAKLKGGKNAPKFTDEEMESAFIPMWLPYEEAKAVMAKSRTTDFEGSAYIVPRDTAFLKTADKYIKDIKK